MGLPEYRFWFVTVDRDPVLAFGTTGGCWNLAGDEFDLLESYEHSDRRLWPVVAAIGGRYLR